VSEVDLISAAAGQFHFISRCVFTENERVHAVSLGLHIQRQRQHLPFHIAHDVKVYLLLPLWSETYSDRHAKVIATQ